MKNPTSRRMDGFTLVELLVVIAIIAVLAGAGFAAGTAAIQKAKKVTALATASALESAVNNFYTEYGSAPVANLTNDTTVETDQAGGVTLLKVLLGAEGTGTSVLNTRAVKFLSVKEGKRRGTAGMNGLIYSGTGIPEGLYDPWGGPYKVLIDGDYDEQITAAPTGGVQAKLNGRKVAAWSEGADYKNSKPGDDVITWNK